MMIEKPRNSSEWLWLILKIVLAPIYLPVGLIVLLLLPAGLMLVNRRRVHLWPYADKHSTANTITIVLYLATLAILAACIIGGFYAMAAAPAVVLMGIGFFTYCQLVYEEMGFGI